MLRETGSTRLPQGPSGRGGPDGDVLRRVIAASADDYEVLGEMVRGKAGTSAFLARELDTSQLVLLRLAPGESGDVSVLTVVRELDSAVVGAEETCPECGAAIVGGGRFCPQCDADVSGARTDQDSCESPTVAAEIARRAAVGRYEIFGTMPRAGGTGVIYFARVLSTGSLVALSLRNSGASGEGRLVPSLQVIQLLRSLDKPRPADAVLPDVSPADDEAPAAQPQRAQPTPHRAAPQKVLIPAGDAPADEKLPPRPSPRTAPWWAVPAALVGAAVIALAAFAKARASLPDGTDARIGSGRMGVAAATMGARAATVTPDDSAYIRISATLPKDARITVDGVQVFSDAMAIPPGEYLLAASAPGRVPVSEAVSVEAGQTIVWTPTLAAAPTPTRLAATSQAPVSGSAAARPRKTSTGGAPTAPVTPRPMESCARAFERQNWTLTASLCASEARDGDVAAQHYLGVMYDRGLGVAQDPARAAAWFQRAAEAGSRDAAYQLATMLESGRGVERDSGRAITWYGKAALLGDRESQVKLGKAYERGVGVRRDMGEALTWYRKAANQGDAWAQNYLGFLYGNGEGVGHDDAEALKWFLKSAAQGNGQAEYNVGFMYANGRGVARSDSEAIGWYRKAAAHGYAEAGKELERRGIEP